MTALRFIMVGGFLGAGKTTTLARLAHTYRQQGRRVAIVTNDQAEDLVDTFTLRSQGFPVGEVAGACFCCHFDELTATVERLSAENRPDVILAEPVGSCTDLVATVVRPLQQLYDRQFSVAPYGVIVKPSHGLKILTTGQRGFSPEAAYIFHKQLEEADYLILNRLDELESEQVERLGELIRQQRGEVPLVRMSAKTGQGFPDLMAQIDAPAPAGRQRMEVDYDRYAAGEAELGWLNRRARFAADNSMSLSELARAMVDQLFQALTDRDAETAHLKVVAAADEHVAVANLVSGEGPVEVSLASARRATQGVLVVNARVAMAPEDLADVVEAVSRSVGREQKVRWTVEQQRSFRPGRPVPTHRM